MVGDIEGFPYTDFCIIGCLVAKTFNDNSPDVSKAFLNIPPYHGYDVRLIDPVVPTIQSPKHLCYGLFPIKVFVAHELSRSQGDSNITFP